MHDLLSHLPKVTSTRRPMGRTPGVGWMDDERDDDLLFSPFFFSSFPSLLQLSLRPPAVAAFSSHHLHHSLSYSPHFINSPSRIAALLISASSHFILHHFTITTTTTWSSPDSLFAFNSLPTTMMSDEEDYDCPLCMEEFDVSDRNFRPCPCGYQVPHPHVDQSHAISSHTSI